LERVTQNPLVMVSKATGQLVVGLIVAGAPDVPSADTLARLVDELHEQGGDPGLCRRKRASRKRSK
jgi:hypothetical protein